MELLHWKEVNILAKILCIEYFELHDVGFLLNYVTIIQDP